MMGLDLNLLRIFDTLFELRSVTRAAAHMNLTQSAISHALGRLRRALDDPLFVRQAGGLHPTAHALAIAPGIREGLQRLDNALAPARFDPASSDREFRINAGIYAAMVLVPRLIARLRVAAPHVTVTVSAPGNDLLASLDSGQVDIAIGAFGRAPPRLQRQPLYTENLVWVARADSPLIGQPHLLDTLPPSRLLNIAVGRPFPGHGAYSWENGLERLVISATNIEEAHYAPGDQQPHLVHNAMTALATVAMTDLVALVPRRLAAWGAGIGDIALIDPAGSAGDMDMAMLWHRRLTSDSGLLWLRAQIVGCIV
jgi:DNA-binding transcriptional LysR family regulator